MQYRKFGNTDMFVSEIGFGAWAIGGGAMIGNTAIGWGDANDDVSRAAIHKALDLGINFFDTADIYGLGHSEELIGQEIGEKKDVLIATKVGNVSRDGQFTVDYSKAYILEACDASLRRLRREQIDYYQLHSARMPHLLDGDCIEAMQLLQQQGKIRYWGISLNTFEPFAEADHFIEKKIGNGFQLVFNMLNQLALPLMVKANGAGYGVIARMPLQFGLLTGKFDQGFTFEKSDHRKGRISKELVNQTNMALKPAWQLCEKYGLTKTQLAISYILSREEVSTVIPGIRTPEQAELNTQGFKKLERQDQLLIEGLATTSLLPVMDLIRSMG